MPAAALALAAAAAEPATATATATTLAVAALRTAASCSEAVHRGREAASGRQRRSR